LTFRKILVVAYRSPLFRWLPAFEPKQITALLDGKFAPGAVGIDEIGESS
jgi:hypothetical protein